MEPESIKPTILTPCITRSPSLEVLTDLFTKFDSLSVDTLGPFTDLARYHPFAKQ